MRFLLFMIPFVLMANNALAVEGLPIPCPVTTEVFSHDPMPEVTGKTNNLRREVGSPINTPGKMIVIKGVVTDDNCIPISDAMVELWQLGLPQSGSIFTNNMGQFEFLTILPIAKGKHAAHVNIRVNRSEFDNFETMAYFGEPEQNALKLQEQGHSEYGDVYSLRIALSGPKQYRKY